jgi:hypothetical protein
LDFSQRIKVGKNTKLMTDAVRIAPPVRNVMYRNKLKMIKSSAKGNSR